MPTARRIARQQFGREHDPVSRAIARVLAAMVWPVAILINLWQVRYWLGLSSTELVLARRRIPDALWVAIRHNVLPSEYFAYGLWLPDRRLNIDNYLYSREGARLFKTLNQPSIPNPIDDKLLFHELCESQAIPTPAVLAAFAPSGELIPFEFSRPPRQDLFIKARTAHSRPELLRWQHEAFESNRGRRIRENHVTGYLTERARNENLTLLVQPVLYNHPALQVEPFGALATARVVTGCSHGGTVTPIFCFLSFGAPGEITAHSNRVMLINIGSGGSMPAPPKEAPGASMYRYQELNASSRLRLPDWQHALHYVTIAHQHCCEFAFIGWDVAFTQHGPVLLEGNANWEAAPYQTLKGEPLGNTPFATVLAERLKDAAPG